jgi:hypothetical protein
MVLALGLSACSEEADRGRAPAEVAAPSAAVPVGPQSKIAGKPAAMKPAMLEVPADKQQLDRLLAMGYTVHDEHLHPPGAKECPFDMGGGVVQ